MSPLQGVRAPVRVSHVSRSNQRKLKQFSKTKTEISFRLVFIVETGDTETLGDSLERVRWNLATPGDSWSPDRLVDTETLTETAPTRG